jgi:hypothetical protein
MERKPVRRVSKKRARLNPLRRSLVREVLEEQPICEARLKDCTGWSKEVHEILTRARGGSILDRENVVALCHGCHHFITINPTWSHQNGWMLSSWSGPADVEIARQCRAVTTDAKR